MSAFRPVTADHILFNECIPLFHPTNPLRYDLAQGENTDAHGYLLLDFQLKQIWDFTHFSIKPTERVLLPDAYSAFIAQASLPTWLDTFTSRHASHLFTTALSAVVSFALGRPVKSPRLVPERRHPHACLMLASPSELPRLPTSNRMDH